MVSMHWGKLDARSNGSDVVNNVRWVKGETWLNVEHRINTMNKQDCFLIRQEWLGVWPNAVSVFHAWWRGEISTLHGKSMSIERLAQAGMVICQYWWSRMRMPTLIPPSSQPTDETENHSQHDQISEVEDISFWFRFFLPSHDSPGTAKHSNINK